MTIFELKDKVNEFDIEAETIATIQFTGNEIANLVRGQMSVGMTGAGKKIKNQFTRRTTYSLWWELERRKRGLQVAHFDFRVTGEFQSKIEVINVTIDNFTVTSKSIKTFDLEMMFGREIMNMTPESRAEYIRTSFYPELQYRIQQKLGLNFSK